MDKIMDMKKINNLLNDSNFDDEDLNENDLEDELEAILSGRLVSRPAAASRPAAPVRQERTSRAPTRRAPAQPNVHSRNVGSSNMPVNAPMMDISQVEKLLKGFDVDTINDDDGEDDHNLEDLESELNQIVGAGGANSPPAPVRPPPTRSIATAKLPTQSNNESTVAPSVPLRPVMSESQQVVQPSHQPALQTTNPYAQKIAQIKQLQIEYKRAALRAKNENDTASALAHMKTSKQLEAMIVSLNANEDVDMAALPPMPQSSGDKAQSIASASSASSVVAAAVADAAELPDVSQEEASQIFNAPKSAGSVLEALEQRLAKFKATQQEATEQQNASKARRLGRIVKQIETAIKDHKAGKPVDYDLLPCPPGFPSISVPSKSEPAPPQQANKPAAPVAPALQPKSPQGSVPKKAANETTPQATTAPGGSQQPLANQPAPLQKPHLKRGLSTTGSKQLKFLLERQRLFREAALEAKKRNEIEQAKEYLRHAKGFDPLIIATQNGLPVDVTSIPLPPQLKNDDGFVVVDAESLPSSVSETGLPNSTFYTDNERDDLFRQIERDLLDQIEMCNRNKEYFIKMGDINTSKKFEKYATDGNKDLNMLRVRWRNNENIPSYRTETRTFSIVVSNHEVGINELQIDVVKAFDLPGKPDIDTYVRIEFPIPSENPQKKKTKTVYNTINPEFNESIKFEIDRKSRSLARLLKRHPIKIEVFAKGGMFRSDSCLGTIQMKVGDVLETKCTIHESIPLTEGRKTLHGRLEVKIKLREPLLAKQIEEIKEKWIVFT